MGTAKGDPSRIPGLQNSGAAPRLGSPPCQGGAGWGLGKLQTSSPQVKISGGGKFSAHLQTRIRRYPSYLRLAALCKQLYYSWIMGVFSALICNKNNFNIKELTTTSMICAMLGKYTILKAFYLRNTFP